METKTIENILMVVITIALLLIGFTAGYFVYSYVGGCNENNIYEEVKFHGGIRFVKYDRDLGKCLWNNQEIDCLRVGEYVNKNPKES